MGRGAAHARRRDDSVPDHSLPRRGGRALRSRGHHRLRQDRRRGHARRVEARDRGRRGDVQHRRRAAAGARCRERPGLRARGATGERLRPFVCGPRRGRDAGHSAAARQRKPPAADSGAAPSQPRRRVPPPDGSLPAGDGGMKLLRDTWFVFGRYFGIFIHNPVWVALGVLQPLLYLILFAPLLKPIAAMRGFPPGGAYNVFVPGLLVQLGMFGAAGVGFSLISELRMGVIERLRVTPVSRVALLFGRALRDMFSIVLQSLILILIALPFGLSIHPLGVVVVLALVGLIGLLTASSAYAVALAVKSEDLNPLLYEVDAARSIFNDQLTDPSVGEGVLILAVLSAIAVVIGARQFGRAVS